jgi:hypothetical protein
MQPVPLRDVVIENGSVSATCPCTIALSDAHEEPSNLDLALRRDGNRLYGSATVTSTGPRTNFALPAYIVLRR